MPSSLNRLVFRRLLAGELITHHGCLHQPLPSSQRAVVAQSRQWYPAHHQRRTFFINIFKKQDRPTKEAAIEPGLEKMMEYAKMERLNARLPTHEDVADAIGNFAEYKAQREYAIEEGQADYLLQSLRYVLQKSRDDGSGYVLGLKKLKVLLKALGVRPLQPNASHRQLSIALYEEIKRRNNITGHQTRKFVLEHLVNALRAADALSEARDYLAAFAQEPRKVNSKSNPKIVQVQQDVDAPAAIPSVWYTLLQSIADTGEGEELLRTVEMMRMRGFDVETDKQSISILAHYYAGGDHEQDVKEWYERYKQAKSGTGDLASEQRLYAAIIAMCMRNESLEFGQSVVRDIVANSPSKSSWDTILVWAAGTGKGVDEIDRMMGVMRKSSNNGHAQSLVDVETINKLVKFAVDRKDPYVAERFIELGKRRGISPNATTLVLQMDYRLDVKDVDGALMAYKYLQSQDLSSNEDVPSVHRLICAMCETGRHDFESIMNVAADLSDRQVRFTAETVSKLSLLHLERGEFPDVVDLLNTHAFNFSTIDRTIVYRAVLGHCLRPSTETGQAWDTYVVARQVFDEIDREERTEIMNDFFRRGRPDMAVHVFEHMRAHSRPSTVATIDTYIACFRGIASVRDEESLEVMHNQLKLDYRIEPNTRVQNSLMLAYTSCDRPRRAIAIWDEIAASSEGPTLNSIHLALRACERAPWGDVKAREIWQRLLRTGIDFDESLWASYAGALVGNGNVTGSVTELEEAQAKGQVDIGAFMIGSLYNAAPGHAKQEEVMGWAKHFHASKWVDLEGVGQEENEDGKRVFKLDRAIDP